MAGFVWNTPTRQNGDRLLPVIPCEIYEEIIAYIEPSDELGLHNCKQIWLSLAKVCRYFCAETMRRFYQSIILSGNSSSDADQQSPASYFNFCSQVRKGVGPRASFSVDVKECLLVDWSSAMVLDVFLDEIVGKALVRMDNLATLSLLNIPVTPTLLKVIRRLKNLESLSIQACAFEGVTVDHLKKLSSLKLKQLSVMTSTMRSIPMDLALAMGVLIENLEELRTNNCLVLKAVLSVSKRKLIPLQVLNLELKFICDSDLVSLCDFLDATPTITNLRFHIGPTPIHFAHLPTSALPKLAKVQAPLHFLKSLASRPLIELHQTWNRFDDPLLSSGSLLSNINGQSLSVLSLSWDLLKERPFQECFPQLHTLTLLDVHELILPEPLGFINFSTTTSAFIKHSKLRNLDLRVNALTEDCLNLASFDECTQWDLNKYHGLIACILSLDRLPVLEKFQMSDTSLFVWRHPFPEDGWKPTVPHYNRDIIRKLLSFLASAGTSYVDRDDCIKSVLEWNS